MPYDTWFDTPENRTLIAICTRKLIKNIGIGGIIWGAINVVIGIMAIQETIINAGILILGVAMLGTGVRALQSPTLGVLLTETIVTGCLFLWNLAMSVLNLMAGEMFDPRGLIFPLVIVFLFANNYRKLGHLRDLIEKVVPAEIDATKRVCKAIVKKKLKEEPAIIQTTDRKCRAQLMDEKVFFIQRDMLRAFIAPRDAVRAGVEKPDAKSWVMAFNHPQGKLKYRFDKQNTGKLREWLSRTADSPGASSGGSGA